MADKKEGGKGGDTREERLFSVSVELRATGGEEDSPLLVGYAARFNVWSEEIHGYFIERIKPGAFKKALMTSDVRALYNHDANQIPLGRTPKTLRLAEDSKGLKVEIEPPDTTLARDLIVSIRRGDISQMSFAFEVRHDGENDGDEWHEKDGVVKRTIHEVEALYDVSPVVFPAYTKTKISARAEARAIGFKSNSVTAKNNNICVTAEDERRNLEIDMLQLNGGF